MGTSPVFLPGEFHGQEPGGLQSMGLQRVGHDWETWHFMLITSHYLWILSEFCLRTQKQYKDHWHYFIEFITFFLYIRKILSSSLLIFFLHKIYYSYSMEFTFIFKIFIFCPYSIFFIILMLFFKFLNIFIIYVFCLFFASWDFWTFLS